MYRRRIADLRLVLQGRRPICVKIRLFTLALDFWLCHRPITWWWFLVLFPRDFSLLFMNRFSCFNFHLRLFGLCLANWLAGFTCWAITAARLAASRSAGRLALRWATSPIALTATRVLATYGGSTRVRIILIAFTQRVVVLVALGGLSLCFSLGIRLDLFWWDRFFILFLRFFILFLNCLAAFSTKRGLSLASLMAVFSMVKDILVVGFFSMPLFALDLSSSFILSRLYLIFLSLDLPLISFNLPFDEDLVCLV